MTRWLRRNGETALLSFACARFVSLAEWIPAACVFVAMVAHLHRQTAAEMWGRS